MALDRSTASPRDALGTRSGWRRSRHGRSSAVAPVASSRATAGRRAAPPPPSSAPPLSHLATIGSVAAVGRRDRRAAPGPRSSSARPSSSVPFICATARDDHRLERARLLRRARGGGEERPGIGRQSRRQDRGHEIGKRLGLAVAERVGDIGRRRSSGRGGDRRTRPVVGALRERVEQRAALSPASWPPRARS